MDDKAATENHRRVEHPEVKCSVALSGSRTGKESSNHCVASSSLTRVDATMKRSEESLAAATITTAVCQIVCFNEAAATVTAAVCQIVCLTEVAAAVTTAVCQIVFY